MQSVMKKSLAVLLTAGTIAAASIVSSSPADARWSGHRHGGWHGGHRGGAVAAGLIGGLALGAIATGGYYGGYYGGPYYRRAYYGGPYYGGYYGPQPYYASAGYYGRRCHIERRWVSTYYGERMRRVRVCY
jgi:hypothetical protein